MIKPEYRNINDVLEVVQEGRATEGVGTFYSEESYPHVRNKEKLSLFDKVLFGKFSKGYTKAEYRNPKRNDFITKGELSS
jgi:hypothetical protein